MVEPRRGHSGAIGGITFAVLFVVGILLPGLPNGESDSAIAEFYADSGNRLVAIVAGYSLILAGVAFLVFLSGLYHELRRPNSLSGSLPTIVLAAGIVFVVMLYGASSAWTNVPAGMEFGGEAQPGVEIPIWFNQLGFGQVLAHGMFAAITVIVSTSLLVLRTGVFPRWLAWLGFACAVVLVFGVMFLPMIAFPIWVIATSVALLRAPILGAGEARQPSAAAAA